MKKRLLTVLFALFVSVIWLFPFETEPNSWVLAIGFFAAFLCLALIPPAPAALAAAAAVTLGMGIYDARFFACFAPAVFTVAALLPAGEKRAALPLKKDGYLLTALLAQGVAVVYSLVYTFFIQKESVFAFAAERSILWVCASILLAAVLWAIALRERNRAPARKNAKADAACTKAVFVYAALLLSQIAVFLYCLKQDVSSRVFSLPALYGAGAGLISVNPVTDTLFHKNRGV